MSACPKCWRGSAALYKARFDDVYDPLIRDCKAHVALGNHDVKGCQLARRTAFGAPVDSYVPPNVAKALKAHSGQGGLRTGATESND